MGSASQVQIANMALDVIGTRSTIASLTEPTPLKLVSEQSA